MTGRSLLIGLCLAAVLLTIGALAFGWPLLVWVVTITDTFRVPFGNLLTAVGMVAGSAAAVLISTETTPSRYFAWAALVASITWFPVGLAWSGNATFVFQGSRFPYWFWYSGASGGLVLLSLLAAVIGAVLRRRTDQG